jgi:hypothetical protein
MLERFRMCWLLAVAVLIGGGCESPVEASSPLLRARLLRGAVDSIAITNVSQQDVRFMSISANALAYTDFSGCPGNVVVAPGASARVVFPEESHAIAAPAPDASPHTRETTAVILHCIASATSADLQRLRLHR